MTEVHDAEMLAIAERLFSAVSAGDVDAVRAIYAPEAVVWHNNDGIQQSVEQNLAVLGWIAANVKGFRYEGSRCQPTPTGFVEQHIARGTAPNGTEFAFPACVVCTVASGRITRLDEYLDSAQIAVLVALPDAI